MSVAILSLGKLCEDHGQKPRFTKEEKTIKCKTDNFVPLVVPGLFASSGSNSFSTATLQDLSSTSPAQERSDELAPGNLIHQKNSNKNKKSDGHRDSDDRLRDLREWSEEFTENHEDTEVPAPAPISHDSDSECPTKVVSKSRKHCVCTDFPKAEIAKSACEPK